MKYTRVLFVLTVLLLAGCGQKGPLYLPASEPAPAATTDASSQTSAPAAATAASPSEP